MAHRRLLKYYRKKRCDNKKPVGGREKGHNPTKNIAGKDELYILAIATTINQESCTAVAVGYEICRDLNGVTLGGTEPPHLIIIPPFVGRISHSSGEVVCPKIDDGMEVVDEMLTG